MAFVIAPELFRVRRMKLDIETASVLTAGQTVRRMIEYEWILALNIIFH